MDLFERIRCIYPELKSEDFISTITLMDDGNGAYIKEWGYSKPKPTEKQLEEAGLSSGAPLSLDEAKFVIQSELNKKAVELGYESILSATSYAGYENPYQAEAKKLGIWRATVWKGAFAYFSGLNGGRMPSKSDVIKMIPGYEP